MITKMRKKKKKKKKRKKKRMKKKKVNQKLKKLMPLDIFQGLVFFFFSFFL